MSKPREIWWSYAKAMVRQYPRIEKIARTHSVGPIKQREINAVKKAIEITDRKSNAKNRMAVVNLVLWNKGCTLEQAAARLYLSETTTCRYHRDFVRLVGVCFGLTE